MATPGIKSKRGAFLRATFDFIFGYENRKGETLDSWIAFLDDFSFSPSEFYNALGKELERRKVPSLAVSHEEFSEGGMLSEKRLYLRFFRERLAIYTCASPFGTGYFFSCRTVYVPALVRLWHILAALLFLTVLGGLLQKPLGFSFSVVAIVSLLIALCAVMRNAATNPFADMDTLLLKIPGVSTIYEDWFRSETYWREDTRTVYLERIPALVREIAENITAEKGVRLERQFEYAPVFGELYRPVPPKGK